MQKMISENIQVEGSEILILGITFKENCPDIRNTKIVDVVNFLKQFNVSVDICDPIAVPQEVMEVFNLELTSLPKINKKYDVIMKLVSHDEFIHFDLEVLSKSKSIIFDLKGDLKGKNVITL